MRSLSSPYGKSLQSFSVRVGHERNTPAHHHFPSFPVDPLFTFFFAIHRIDDDKHRIAFFLEALNQIFATPAELVRVKERSEALELVGSEMVEALANITGTSS